MVTYLEFNIQQVTLATKCSRLGACPMGKGDPHSQIFQKKAFMFTSYLARIQLMYLSGTCPLIRVEIVSNKKNILLFST